MQNYVDTKTFELIADPSIEDIAGYYREAGTKIKGIGLSDDFLNDYLGLSDLPSEPEPSPSPLPQAPKPGRKKKNVTTFTKDAPDNTVTTKDKSYVIPGPSENTHLPMSQHEVKTAKAVVDFFVNKGLTKEQAAGIAGNLYAESNFRLDVLGDEGRSYGIAQWNGPRLKHLQKFAHSISAPIGALETQLEFIWKELQTTENKAFKHLLDSKTVVDAAKSFAHKFERMKVYNDKRHIAADIFLKIQ
jgi:hypothetical protein